MTEVEAALDAHWLAIPDCAEEVGIDLRSMRNLIREGAVVAVPVAGLTGKRIPSAFLVGERGAARFVDGLRGSVTQLRDSGLDDVELVVWLLSPHAELGAAPAVALAAGQKHAVRRAALGLAF